MSSRHKSLISSSGASHPSEKGTISHQNTQVIIIVTIIIIIVSIIITVIIIIMLSICQYIHYFHF